MKSRVEIIKTGKFARKVKGGQVHVVIIEKKRRS